VVSFAAVSKVLMVLLIACANRAKIIIRHLDEWSTSVKGIV